MKTKNEQNDLAVKINTDRRNEAIINGWKAEFSNTKTLCFCVNVEHAVVLTNAFRAHGISAEMIIGETPLQERARIIANFEEGKTKVITGVDVFNEGFDCPGEEEG